MSDAHTNAEMNGAVTVSISLDRRDVAVPISPLPIVYHVPRCSLLCSLYYLVVSNFLPFVVAAKERYCWLLRIDRKTCAIRNCDLEEPLLWHSPVGLIADAIGAMRGSSSVSSPLYFTATCGGIDHRNIDCANDLNLFVGQLVKQSLAVLFGTTRPFMKLSLQHTNLIRSGVLIAKTTSFADVPRIHQKRNPLSLSIGEPSKHEGVPDDETQCYSDHTSHLTASDETHSLLFRTPTQCAGTVEEAVEHALFFDHGKVLDTMAYIRTQIHQEMGGDGSILAFPVALHWLKRRGSSLFSASTVRSANVPQEFRDNSSSRERYSIYFALVQAIALPFLRPSIFGDCSCEQEFADIIFSEKASHLTGVVDSSTEDYPPLLHVFVYAALSKKIFVGMKQQKSAECWGVSYTEVLQWLCEDDSLMRSVNELKETLDTLQYKRDIEYVKNDIDGIEKASAKLTQLLSDAQESYYQRFNKSVGGDLYIKLESTNENPSEDPVSTNLPHSKITRNCGNWGSLNSFLRCYHIMESLRTSARKCSDLNVPAVSVTVTIQGISPHLETPMMWLYQHYTSSDMKLHMLIDVGE